MKLLLDTNVFIWASSEPELLTSQARTALIDPYNERFVSLTSIWEMQIEHALGKLALSAPAHHVAEAWMKPLAARLLPIELRHVGQLYELPRNHRDPFDRMLIAQALVEDMHVVTPDSTFGSYAVPLIW
jgi:PIN domain nuclease of toxin-antitoxin system